MKRIDIIDQTLAEAGVSVSDKVYAVMVELWVMGHAAGSTVGFGEGWAGCLRAIDEQHQADQVTVW